MSCLSVGRLAMLWALIPAVLFAEHARTGTEWRQALVQFEILRNQHKYSEAERVMLDLWKELRRSAPDDEWFAGVSHELGAFYYDQGRTLESERYYKFAIEFWNVHKPARVVRQVCAVNNLAILYLDQYRPEMVRQLYARYLPGWLSTLPPDDLEISSTWNNLGTMHYERREFAEAESYWREAIAVWEKSADSNRTHLIALLNNMGTLYSRTGRFEKALDIFARILPLEAAITDKEALALIKSNMNAGAIYCRLKRFEESEKHYDKALQQALNAFNLDHPIAVTVAARYAKALRTMHRKDKAKQMAKLERLLREVCPASATAQTIDLNEMMRSIR